MFHVVGSSFGLDCGSWSKPEVIPSNVRPSISVTHAWNDDMSCNLEGASLSRMLSVLSCLLRSL